MLRNASWLPPSKGKESNAFEDQTVELGRGGWQLRNWKKYPRRNRI